MNHWLKNPKIIILGPLALLLAAHIGVWIIRHRHARPGGGYGSPRSPFADSHGADIGAVFERWLGHGGPCSYYSAHRDARSDG